GVCGLRLPRIDEQEQLVDISNHTRRGFNGVSLRRGREQPSRTSSQLPGLVLHTLVPNNIHVASLPRWRTPESDTLTILDPMHLRGVGFGDVGSDGLGSRKRRHMRDERVTMDRNAVESMQANLDRNEPAIFASYGLIGAILLLGGIGFAVDRYL